MQRSRKLTPRGTSQDREATRAGPRTGLLAVSAGCAGAFLPPRRPLLAHPGPAQGAMVPGGRPRRPGTVRPSAALAYTLLFFLLPPVCGAHEVKFFLFETRHFEQTQALSISLHWGFPNL